MKRKSISILQVIVIVLQALALVVTLGFTAIQPIVKSLFTSDSAVLEYFSIPINCLLKIIPLLFIYIMGLLLVEKASAKTRRTTAAILLGFAILLNIVLQYGDTVTSYFIARNGAMALASHAALERAIYMIANPLTCAAFALFCFACGGCFGAEEQS